jgi:hypothetical protein
LLFAAACRRFDPDIFIGTIIFVILRRLLKPFVVLMSILTLLGLFSPCLCLLRLVVFPIIANSLVYMVQIDHSSDGFLREVINSLILPPL